MMTKKTRSSGSSSSSGRIVTRTRTRTGTGTGTGTAATATATVAAATAGNEKGFELKLRNGGHGKDLLFWRTTTTTTTKAISPLNSPPSLTNEEHRRPSTAAAATTSPMMNSNKRCRSGPAAAPIAASTSAAFPHREDASSSASPPVAARVVDVAPAPAAAGGGGAGLEKEEDVAIVESTRGNTNPSSRVTKETGQRQPRQQEKTTKTTKTTTKMKKTTNLMDLAHRKIMMKDNRRRDNNTTTTTNVKKKEMIPKQRRNNNSHTTHFLPPAPTTTTSTPRPTPVPQARQLFDEYTAGTTTTATATASSSLWIKGRYSSVADRKDSPSSPAAEEKDTFFSSSAAITTKATTTATTTISSSNLTPSRNDGRRRSTKTQHHYHHHQHHHHKSCNNKSVVVSTSQQQQQQRTLTTSANSSRTENHLLPRHRFFFLDGSRKQGSSCGSTKNNSSSNNNGSRRRQRRKKSSISKGCGGAGAAGGRLRRGDNIDGDDVTSYAYHRADDDDDDDGDDVSTIITYYDDDETMMMMIKKNFEHDKTPRELIAMGAAIDHLCHGGNVSELAEVVEFEIRDPINGPSLLSQTYELTGECVAVDDDDDDDDGAGGRDYYDRRRRHHDGGGRRRGGSSSFLCGHPLVVDTFRDLSMNDTNDRRSRNRHRRGRSRSFDHRTFVSEQTVGSNNIVDDENSFDRTRTHEGDQTVESRTIESSLDHNRTVETIESIDIDQTYCKNDPFESIKSFADECQIETFKNVDGMIRTEKTLGAVELPMDQYRHKHEDVLHNSVNAIKRQPLMGPLWEAATENEEKLFHETIGSHSPVILPISESFEKVARNYNLRSGDSDDLAASFDNDDTNKHETASSSDIPVFVYKLSEEEDERKQMAGCLGNNVVGGFAPINLTKWPSLISDPSSLMSETQVPYKQEVTGEENDINDDNRSWSEGYSMAVNGIAQRVQSLISLKAWNDDSFDHSDAFKKTDSFDKSPTYTGTILHDTLSKPDNSFTTAKSESTQPSFRQFPGVGHFSTYDGTGTYVRKLDTSYEEPIEVECDNMYDPIDISFDDSIEAWTVEVPMKNRLEVGSIPPRQSPAKVHTPTRRARSFTTTGRGSMSASSPSISQTRRPTFIAKEEGMNREFVGGRQQKKKKKGFSTLRRVLRPSKAMANKTPSKPKMCRVMLDDSLI